MIDEAIGKILGMAMAYVASAMGMFVAYWNYRKRIVKAEKVMTPAAWGVIAITVLATLGGVYVVGQLAAERPSDGEPVEVAAPTPEAAPETVPEPPVRKERRGVSWLGIVLPAAIFLFATVVTTGLHRHFSSHGH